MDLLEQRKTLQEGIFQCELAWGQGPGSWAGCMRSAGPDIPAKGISRNHMPVAAARLAPKTRPGMYTLVRQVALSSWKFALIKIVLEGLVSGYGLWVLSTRS